MAKKPGRVEDNTEQNVPLYKARLSIGLEHLSSVFGYLLARVLVAFALVLLVFLAVSFVSGLIWYLSPIFSANDKLSTADRRDLVQGIASVAQAAAVGLAGAVGLVGLFFTWRSLEQARLSQVLTQENTQRTLELTEQGQITERFTRAIDQLGATDNEGKNKKLEIRLGGIYALERIARDSPERDYSTVMEVLTAYVRENTPLAPRPTPLAPRPSKGSSEVTSKSNDAPAEADEGAKQPTPPEPRRPTADIQAILDVLSRAQTRVPDKYRTSLDLHEATLQGADLQGARLWEAKLWGAQLQGANLQGAQLQGANLYRANLQGAYLLLGADLQGANLGGADLQGAKVTDEQLAATWALQGATMPDGRTYEDWLKDKKGSGKDVENE